MDDAESHIRGEDENKILLFKHVKWSGTNDKCFDEFYTPSVRPKNIGHLTRYCTPLCTFVM